MVKKKKILIIDDEESLLNMLSVLLRKEGYEVSVSENGEKALKSLESGDYQTVVCDIRMPGMDGLEILKRAKTKGIKTPFIMMSAYGTVETALEAMRMGAYDYLNKPFQAEEILLRLKMAEERENLRKENQILNQVVRSESSVKNFVAKNKEMIKILDVIKKVADYKSTILLTGESGTGKDLLARMIHFNSSREKMPFIPVNCGAIPENLLESELFGHQKGSFTGAFSNHVGLFEAADGGTIFLDEIGELPLNLQVKLLRILQDGEVYRVGDTKPVKVEVRVIAATARDLEAEVRAGRFREDLFYRLNVVRINVPPLRERKEDVPFLVDFLIDKFNRKLGKKVKNLTPAAFKLILENEWRGNVRELENVLERAMIMVDGDRIDLKDLPDLVARTTSPAKSTARKSESVPGGEGLPPEADQEDKGFLKDMVEILKNGDISIPHLETELEKGLIQIALKQSGWNRSRAAELLGISRRALFYKVKQYDLE
ncbi:MAG: sigma-54 dependent transcriptional regulator [Proteobacteria bacterium]|nr:sigma-54 dependent transcriptional regulator [Pseudomonadota bacterium]